MLSIPDVPTFHEWVMHIQQNAAQAKQLLIALKAKNKQQGLFVDPSLQIGIEAYERAQDLFAKAATDPEQAERIARIARIGRATVGPYPDRDDWIALVKDDPDFSRSLYMALRVKEAMFGSQAPYAITLSIAAYEAATGGEK
jgi:hypothetical protein